MSAGEKGYVNQMEDYKIGYKYRVKNTYSIPEFCGLIGTLVVIEPDWFGLDFGRKIDYLRIGKTWDLNGHLPKETGRFFSSQYLELVEKEWDD